MGGSVTAYFDFPPCTYVLPALYSILLILLYKYSLISVFRAWIAKLENRISPTTFILYSCSFIYFCISAALFATFFAVQSDPEKPESTMVHNLPLINIIFSLTILQIAVTWFGRKVCWKALKHSSEYTKKRRIVFITPGPIM